MKLFAPFIFEIIYIKINANKLINKRGVLRAGNNHVIQMTNYNGFPEYINNENNLEAHPIINIFDIRNLLLICMIFGQEKSFFSLRLLTGF